MQLLAQGGLDVALARAGLDVRRDRAQDAGLAIVLEVCLRRTRWGLTLRAAGSREDSAHRLGVAVGTVKSTASRAVAQLRTHPSLAGLFCPADFPAR